MLARCVASCVVGCQAVGVTDSNAEHQLPPRGSALFRPRKARRPGSVNTEQLVAELAAQARARRKVAQHMARDLAFPPGRRPGDLSEFVRAKLMYVKYESTDEVLLAFPVAPRLVAIGPPDSVGYFQGPGGLVLYIHDVDELWDMVVPVEPFRDFVLLGVEDVEDVFFLLTADGAKAISAFTELVDGVTTALRTRADLAKRGLMPPLHQGYSASTSSSAPISSESSS